jgi:hypothetical protein
LIIAQVWRHDKIENTVRRLDMMESMTKDIIISKTSINKLHSDSAFYKLIYDLVAPSYVDPTAMMLRDIANCDRIYLAHDKHGILCAFFMVGQDKIYFKNNLIDIFYLGLGATSTKTKNSGMICLLYQAFINDVQLLESQLGKRIPLWHTTVIPSVFHVFNIMFEDSQPDVKGSYTEEGKILASAIRAKKDWIIQPNDYPFVVKGVAHNTLYSEEEVARIQKICKEKNFTLFDELGIKEKNGDRLIGISYAPITQINTST